MQTFKEVEKKEAISYEEFIVEYAKKGVPVVFKNALPIKEPQKVFTPDFFSEKFGNYKTKLGTVEYTMDEILEVTKNSTPENPSPYPILFEIPLQMPGLLEMLSPKQINYAQPNWFNSNLFPYGRFGKNTHLFIGGRGNQYVLHKDTYHTNAWITQLYGEKKFVVFPREQSEYLYAGKEGMSRFLSPINILKPDLDLYPDYQKATPLEVILQPGETIFIPNGVWHTTVSLGHNISLIFDQLNGLNYKAWKKDMYELKKGQSRLKALIQYGFAVSVGSACKAARLTGAKF